MVIDTGNISSSGSGRNRSATPVANTPKTHATASETAASEAAALSSKDNVKLSPEAQNLSRLQAKINQLPDVNLERVAAIKLAIAEGRFEINPERIAENMLNQDALLN